MRQPTAPVQAVRQGFVSRAIVEAAYRDYARRQGTSQSLVRLLERGGFSWAELTFHLYSELVHQRQADGDRPYFHDHIRVDQVDRG